jgi:AcrR family transcriptional regulator
MDSMARPLDADVSRRILSTTVELLLERGYAALSLEVVAARAQVSKPALYRRHRNKLELCVAAIESLLGPPLPQIEGTFEERIRAIYFALAGADLEPYVAAVGDLLGLSRTESALIDAWRASVFAPRRAIGVRLMREAQEAGAIRGDIDVDFAIDSLTGQLLARVWRGLPLDDEWRQSSWQQLWLTMKR